MTYRTLGKEKVMRWLTWTALMMITSFGGCNKEAQQTSNNLEVASNTQSMEKSELLVARIKTVSEDVGENGQRALDELRALPQKEVISDMLRLRGSLAPDDSLQPQIAFVFCYLDYECPANTKLVVSSFSKTPKYRSFDADQAAALLSRLMKRGDKTLLPVLLSSVTWSEGALSEELGATFGDELTRNSEDFLVALRDQPKELRSQTYQMIENSGGISAT
jgi:hypothetical protein